MAPTPDQQGTAIAEQVRAALVAHDPAMLEPLLAPDARWGSCVGSGQVVDWIRGATADGMTADISRVVPYADRVVLELEVRRCAPDGSVTEPESILQVAFIRDGKIVELGDAADHEEARTASPTPVPARPSGPATGVQGMAAVLAVRDLPAALEHYRRLGFDVRAYEGGGYGYAARDGANFHLNVFARLDPWENTSTVYLYVDDADALYTEWRTSGVTGQFFEPENTEYGLREGAHSDRDGNLIRFGSPLDQANRAGEQEGSLIGTDEPLAVEIVDAIHTGEVHRLERLLVENPGLARARLGTADPDGMTRTLLHVATDWPGHFPNVGATVAALIEAGSDVDARFTGPHTETALHWAASSDDVEALDALSDAGADLEAPGAVIAGGTPLTDAVAFGQWNVARRLVERGAQTPLREAAALGLMDRVDEYCTGKSPPTPGDLTQALWYACHGNQQGVADDLLERGADVNWISSWDELTPLDAASREGADDLVEWLRDRGAKSTGELR